MTVELGSWYIHLIYIAVFAFIMVGLSIHSYIKGQQYKQEVRGKIKAVIKRETGFPLKKVVTPTIDGYVRVDKGDYKLPDPEQQKEILESLPDEDKRIILGNRKVRVPKAVFDLLEEEEKRIVLGQLSEQERRILMGYREIIPSAMEWDYYPDKPFLWASKVPIRVQEWYENDPRPITWLRDREPEVTAVEMQGHTRQMDAQSAGIRAKELESKSRQMMEMFNKIPEKTWVYIGLVAAIAIGVINLVRSLGISIGI